MAKPLVDFRARIAASEDAARVLEPGAAARVAVVADLKPEPRARGGFKLRRCYWSAQRHEADGGFDALTLEYYAKRAEASWHRFPADPCLHLEALPAQAEVLRYVPLRRLTFRARDAAGRPVLGKIKRPVRADEARARLAAVASAVARARPGFDVATPREAAPALGLDFQDHLPGRDLAALLGPHHARDLLARAGALHAALHDLEVPDLDTRVPTDHARALAADAAWVAHAWPPAAETIHACAAALAATLPEPAAPVFCHGDFVCSQVLVHEPRWAVVDFDRCVADDRHAELGLFLASLHYDPPCFADGTTALPAGAGEAYLDAYAERAGRNPDPRRLTWYRARAELHYLSLRLRKDRAEAAAMAAGLGRLRAACTALAGLDGAAGEADARRPQAGTAP